MAGAFESFSDRELLHAVEGLLQDLPIFRFLHLLAVRASAEPTHSKPLLRFCTVETRKS